MFGEVFCKRQGLDGEDFDLDSVSTGGNWIFERIFLVIEVRGVEMIEEESTLEKSI
jgi:hypothetical protein